MHALDAIDLLLQRSGYRRFHNLSIGAYIVAGNRNLRRCQIGIKGDWQRWNANRSGKDDEQRAYGGKDRPMNKEVNQTGISSLGGDSEPELSRDQNELADWLHGCPIDKQLNAGDDHLVSALQTADHGVVISYRVAQSDRALFGYGALIGLRR